MAIYTKKYAAVYKGNTYLGLREFGGSEEENAKITLVSKEPIDDDRCVQATKGYELKVDLSEVDEYYMTRIGIQLGGKYYGIMSAIKKDRILYVPAARYDNNPVFSSCGQGLFGYPSEMMVYVPDGYVESIELTKYYEIDGRMQPQEPVETDLETMYFLVEQGLHE